DNKNDLGMHRRVQTTKFVQQAQIEPLYYHENKSLVRFPGSSTVEHSAVNRELQFKSLVSLASVSSLRTIPKHLFLVPTMSPLSHTCADGAFVSRVHFLKCRSWG